MESDHVQSTSVIVMHPIEIDDSDDGDEAVEHEISHSSNLIKIKRHRNKPPTDRSPGQTLLPISKVEAIVQADGGNGNVSKEAMFMLSIATEEFIKRLAQSAHGRSELDRRTMIQYRDIASTAYHFEEFQFLQDIIPTPMPLHRAMALREARLRGETIVEANSLPTRSTSSSTAVSTPTTKGKGKSRASNGKSSEKVSGKSIAPRERVRDSKGRWSLSLQVPSGSRANVDVSNNHIQKAKEEETSYIAKSNMDGMVWGEEDGRQDANWKASPHLSKDQVSITHQRSSISGSHQRSSNNGNVSAVEFPLWTRIPLPRPPSATISSSQLRNHVVLEPDLHPAPNKSSQIEQIPSLTPPLQPSQSDLLSSRKQNNHSPFVITVKRPPSVDTSAMDVDATANGYSMATTQSIDRTICTHNPSVI